MARETSYPVKKLVYLTEELSQKIADFRFDRRIPSENEAVRQILDAGLSAPALSPEVAAALDAAAAKAGKPPSFILDVALRAWLKERGLMPKEDQAGG